MKAKGATKKKKGKKSSRAADTVNGVVAPTWTLPAELVDAIEEADEELAAAKDERLKAEEVLRDAEAQERAAALKLEAANIAADSAAAAAGCRRMANGALAVVNGAPAVANGATAVKEESTATSPPAPSPVMPPPASGPVRKADWNPLNLEVPGVPLFKDQFVPDYLRFWPTYLDGTLPGDIGFDPWGLTVLASLPLDAKSLESIDKNSRTAEERNKRMLSLTPEEQQEKVMWMRASELKHGRLAMLAAAGWPLAEMFNRTALRAEGFTNGRAPSLFNGHLFDYFPFLLLAFGGLAALEVTTKDTVKDGNYGFDPLEFSKNGGMSTLQTAEIKHGRAAMMAITGFAVQEFVYGTPVIDQTPFFFLPFGGLFT